MARAGRQYLSSPARPRFDVITLVHAGSGTHTIDREEIPFVPRRMIRAKAGQMESWDLGADVDATLIRFSVATHPILGATWSGSCDLDDNSYRTALGLVEALRCEQRRFDGDGPAVHLMNALGSSLDALFERSRGDAVQRPHPAYVAFCASIDERAGFVHSVRDHARKIGYSERTVTRACQHATGLTAKGVLDERLLLEAQRLLAHTSLTAASIAERLGFTEATNFTKFFRRHTGLPPTEFRLMSSVA